MVCYINRSTVSYDVRLQKYVQACIDTDTKYIVLSWDRNNDCNKVYKNEFQFKKHCPYGSGKKNVLAMILWSLWLVFNLIKYRHQYKVIHACNIENALLAFPLKLLGKKIIMDIYDTVNVSAENWLAKKVDALILPHELRLKQIAIDKTDLNEFLEVENVPYIYNANISRRNKQEDKIILSYVGVFQKEIRGIENLIDLVIKDDRFILNIAGTGGGLDNTIIGSAETCDRIHYFGKVDYEFALKIMSESDFIVALYYLSAKTHKYASPNKYYESLCLGVPIITSKGTLVGERVIKDDTGYAINDTYEALKDLFQDVKTKIFYDSYKVKQFNCTKLWSQTYCDYYNSVLKKKYLKLVKSI